MTHDAHRIHWDRDFCRKMEGHSDLVVHGPLLADALRARRRTTPRRFAFRAVAPILVTTPIRIEASTDGASGRVLRSDTREAMTGEMAWDQVRRTGLDGATNLA